MGSSENYSEQIKEMLEELKSNSENFERNKETIINIKEKYSKFIKYYPEISDELEKKLNIRNNISAEISIDKDAFERQLLDILKSEDFNIDLTKDEISDFIEKVDNYS